MDDCTGKSLFINLVSDRPANVAKALRLGRKFVAGGWSATLYLNLDGVALADPRTTLDPCPVSGVPLGELLAAFLGEGGRCLVGAECLKLAGLNMEQVPPGLELGAFPLTEALLGADGVRVITY